MSRDDGLAKNFSDILFLFFFHKKSPHMPTYPTITPMGIFRWGHMLG